jgi:hypothetical protein
LQGPAVLKNLFICCFSPLSEQKIIIKQIRSKTLQKNGFPVKKTEPRNQTRQKMNIFDGFSECAVSKFFGLLNVHKSGVQKLSGLVFAI